MNRQQLEELVRSASFTANSAAIEEITKGSTQAQVTCRAVTAAIEFLYGNELIDVDTRKLDGFSLQVIFPPYPREIEE